VEAKVEHFPELLEERGDHPLCLKSTYQAYATM
jgi:hypothetical protein